MDPGQLQSFVDLVAEHREVAEDTARLAPAVVGAAGDQGLWVATAPREVGGLELPLTEFMSLVEAVSVADPTVAWHIVNSAGVGHAAAFVPEWIRDDVFASTARPFGLSGAVAAGVEVTRESDGFRLQGTWPFMTGAKDAGWACVTVTVPPEEGQDAGPPDIRRALVPVDACEIGTTWEQASSMRGTGSHAVTADGVVIPAEATIPFRARPLIDRTPYRLPLHYAFLGGGAATAVGILRSTIEGVIELCATKVSRFDGRRHFDDPQVQQTIADATAAADGLSASLHARAAAMHPSYENGSRPSALERARWWAVVLSTPETAASHVSSLYRIATSSAFGTRNRVERGLRDVHALTASNESFAAIRRAAGAVLLGQDPKHPML